MKAGIIGFSGVGKTTLFKILTKTDISSSQFSRRKDTAIGIASVPDQRLDELSILFKPKKTTYATVEYVDIPAINKGIKKNQDLDLENLRTVDVLLHVIGLFNIDLSEPNYATEYLRNELTDFELELILCDLSIIEKRLEKLDKELKKLKDPDLKMEESLLQKCRIWLEEEKPLRSLDFSQLEQKRLRGFTFLSQKPMLHVLNLPDESSSQIYHLNETYQLQEITEQAHVEISGICGKLEAEMTELSDQEVTAFLSNFGLLESGLIRIITKTYQLLGMISFFTVGEDECRAWTIQHNTTALKAAGAIHSDIERCFIRAEVVRWNILLETRSLFVARQKGLMKLEGKNYTVQDGDTINFRHSA